MPEEGIKKKAHQDILSLEEIENIARAAVDIGIRKIRLTGGEPLVRKGILKLVKNLAQIRGLEDLSLTTNGTLLGKYAQELHKAGLKRINISLDSLDKEKYKNITRGGCLAEVFEGIEAAKAAGLGPIKINVVLIKGFNDDEIKDFVKLTLDEKIEVRFIELMPLGEVHRWDSARYVSNDEVLRQVPELIPLPENNYEGVCKMYKLPEGKGLVGLISPISNHFCGECNRIRVTSDGKLKPCLHSNIEINIKNANEENLRELLINGINAKPETHSVKKEEFVPVKRNMNEIGG
jgi:cyclic pyranopterin phosphate synthase